MLKRLTIATAAMVAVVAAAALVLTWFDWNTARDWISTQAKSRTERELVIGGDLRVHPFSLNPRISAAHVTLGNAAWGERKPMLSAGKVEFSLSLIELVRGRIVLPDVRLENPVLLLQRDGQGRRNWILDPDGGKTAASPQIVQLQVDDGELEFRDEISDTALHGRISTTSDEKYGVEFSARGRVTGIPLTTNGVGGRLLTLLDERVSYPLRLQATVGATAISLDGAVNGIATLSALDAQFTIAGKNLASLSDALRIVLPPTAPYRLAGHLSKRSDMWHFTRFRGSVGRSDLGGNLTVDNRTERPLLRGTLTSSLLDIADLGGFVGAGPGVDSSPRPGGVLPQAKFDLEKLRRADADINFVADRFRNRGALPLDNLKTRLKLNDGVLELAPITFGVAGGSMRSTVRFDATKPRIRARIDTDFRRLHINRLAPRAGILDSALGTIDGSARLAGSGNSIADLLGTADGRLVLISAGGRISNLLLEFAGADGGEIIKFLLAGDREVALRCGATAFNVKQGLMTSEVIVLDTDDTNIVGSGTVSLRDETLNLTLNPLPKDISILSLRGPLHITGSFADPAVGLDKGVLSLRGAAALLLGMLNPLAALLPLIETGPGKDSDCVQLNASLADAARRAAKTPVTPRTGGKSSQTKR